MTTNSPNDPFPRPSFSSLTQKELEDRAFFERYECLKRADLTGDEMAVIMGFASDSGIHARINAINRRQLAPPRDLAGYIALRFWGREITVNGLYDELSQLPGLEKFCQIHASAILKVAVAAGYFDRLGLEKFRNRCVAPQFSVRVLADSRPAGEVLSAIEAAALLAGYLGFPVSESMALECLKVSEAESLYSSQGKEGFRRTGEPVDFGYSDIWERSLVMISAKATRYLSLGEGHLNTSRFEELRTPLIQRGGAGWPALGILRKLDAESFKRTGVHDNGNRNFVFMVVIHPVGVGTYDIAEECSPTVLALHRADPFTTIIRPTTATLDEEATNHFGECQADWLATDLKSRFLAAVEETAADASSEKKLFRAALVYGRVR